MMRVAGLACGIVILAMALLGGARHYSMRDCFNEAGRCLDSVTGVVYLQQTGIAWALLAVVGAALVACSLRRIRSAKSKTPRS